MEIAYDTKMSASNIALRGLSFDLVEVRRYEQETKF